MKITHLIEQITPRSNSYGTDENITNGEFDTTPSILGTETYYTFTDIQDYRYMVNFTKLPKGLYDVGFQAIPSEHGSTDWTDYLNLSPTNQGNPLTVFGVIAYLMSEFSDTHKVNAFRFAASDESKKKIYSKMIKSPQVQSLLSSSGFKYAGSKMEKLIMYGDVEYHYFTNGSLTESYEDDMKYQDEATMMYDTIKRFFTNTNSFILENNLHGDKYIFNFGKWLFAIAKADKFLDAGYGFSKSGKPFIIVYLMTGDTVTEQELKQLVTHFRWKQKIIHEAIHLLDHTRYSPTFKTEYDIGNVSAENYYNAPSELNTHFHEILAYAKDVGFETLKQKYTDASKLTQYLYDVVFAKMGKYLTDENRKRMKKRIYRLASNIIQS